MSITVLILILILLVLGLLYIIYSIKVAEVQDGVLDEEFDEKAFSKPAGWKVGTMPKELQSAKKITLAEKPMGKPNFGIEDVFSKWNRDELSKINRPD